ncbi:hypothetical protein ABMA28_008252 [Loxostege sticticalis]|uniref:RNA-directed DNA polymerase n=1 Tax=Loxostege sticticalis TaxID=481309 RepID=A0ABD0SGJ5_LOXSC
MISHKFHIVNDINLPYDGIIGSDFLTAFNCNINYTKDTLKIFKNTLKLYFNDPFYIIPPRTEAVIECSVKNPEVNEGIIIDQHLSDSLLVSNCITKVKDNNRVIITIANISEKPANISTNLNLNLEPIHRVAFQNTENNPRTVSDRTAEVIKLLRTSHLNEEESEALLDLCSRYSDIFHLPDDQLSYTTALQHEIKTNTDVPVHTKSYRFPECHKKEVSTQIQSMLDQNIIEPSSSPWSSPIWVVPKKLDSQGQKKWRVVIDYRKLNDVTIGETYPIPQISEILDQLGSSKYFTTLDLISGFHQIPIKPDDAPKTAFSVPEGHFQFNRMPFGLKNAPSTFQKLMNTCLSGLQGSRCFVYLDDIVIYSFDLSGHIKNLTAVFDRLRDFNLKLKPEKCEFLRKEVTYLGHIIGEDGVRPNPEKVKAVTDFPTPKTAKDIKSFLGLVSYYRRFIPDFSKHAKSLTSLLKKDVPFEWKNEQQLSFETLKNKLVTAPILAYPDFTKPFLLTCDASNHAISAILSQGPIGQDLPIAYASRTLNKAETNYSVTEKECLAIVFGTKVFRPYLYGNRFEIITDHKPLQWLFNCKDPGSRLIRWRLKLEEFEYNIQYKKGKTNSNADALSRFPVNPIQQEDLPPQNNAASQQDVSTPNPENIPDATTQPQTDPPFSPLTLDDLDIKLPSSVGTGSDDLPCIDLLEGDQIPLENYSPEHNSSPAPDINSDELSSPQPSTSRQSLGHSLPTKSNSNESYSKFLQSIANKDFISSTVVKEHNSNISKTPSTIVVIPTSVDLDESNHSAHELLSNIPDTSEILSQERALHSFISFEHNSKVYYLLFTKVHHFDNHSYEDIYKALRNLRDELVLNPNRVNVTEFAITDFKNPFDKLQYIKIYNMFLYLFHNLGITCHNALEPLTVQYHDILAQSESISHLIDNRLRRGAWIGGLGTVVKTIIGNLDENDGIKFDEAITSIQNNQNKLASYMKDNILITKSVISNYNKTLHKIQLNEATLLEAIDKLSINFNNLSSTTNELQLQSEFNFILNNLETTILTLSFQLEDIVSAITLCSQNILHPAVITPAHLHRELADNYRHLPSSLELPISLDLNNIHVILRLSRIICYFSNNKIIFRLKYLDIILPLVNLGAALGRFCMNSVAYVPTPTTFTCIDEQLS